MGGVHIRNDCVLKLADLRFERVPAIEEHYVFATGLPGIHQRVKFLGLEVLPAAHHAVGVHLQFTRRANDTISSRTLTLRRGKSAALPSDHLKSMS